MDSEAPVKVFLRDVAEGKFASLDMQNKIEQLTGLNPQKLKRLENDLKKEKEEEDKKAEARKNHYDQLEALLKDLGKNRSSFKPSMPQIALLYFYEKKTITRENGDEIAGQYGHQSGDRLYNMFTKYSKQSNRTGGSTDCKKFRNKIKLIESVISLLKHNTEAQQWAERELAEMKKKEKEYE